MYNRRTQAQPRSCVNLQACNGEERSSQAVLTCCLIASNHRTHVKPRPPLLTGTQNRQQTLFSHCTALVVLLACWSRPAVALICRRHLSHPCVPPPFPAPPQDTRRPCLLSHAHRPRLRQIGVDGPFSTHLGGRRKTWVGWRVREQVWLVTRSTRNSSCPATRRAPVRLVPLQGTKSSGREKTRGAPPHTPRPIKTCETAG